MMKTPYKPLCAALALICLFSAAMTGTLAYRDSSQHKSSEFYGHLTGGPAVTPTPYVPPVVPPAEPPPVSPSGPPPGPPTDPGGSADIEKPGGPGDPEDLADIEKPSGPDTPDDLAGLDRPSGPDNPGELANAGRPGIPNAPKTGGGGAIWVWAVVMIASALGLRFLPPRGRPS